MGRLAPDIFFGGLATATTPGDLGDRLIAGGTQFLGGGLGVRSCALRADVYYDAAGTQICRGIVSSASHHKNDG